MSLHGLVRGFDMELGRDADTGGQIKYVVELAKSLAKYDEIERIDLITRKIIDPKVDISYSKPIEKLNEKANIIRIPFGPERYLRKEILWRYLNEFNDHVLHYFRQLRKIPDLIHGHYADAGLAGARLAQQLSVPFVFTGHSLGRIKKERLLQQGRSEDLIESRYNISMRIEAEEFALQNASLIITSTSQERDEQYKSYQFYNPSKMRIIPPGVNMGKFFPYNRKQQRPKISDELERFLKNPSKPIILALARADERKNINSLIKAFGECRELRKNANLVVIAGNRDDIRTMEPGSKRVLTNMLFDIDKFDLYGISAYPKTHNSKDVPELYRLTAKTKGVFVNPAFTEPFGLTLIEAAACGIPIIATDDGGPRDIIANCENGILINPTNLEQISNAILEFIKDKDKWKRASLSGIKGVRNNYSWNVHSKRYIKNLTEIIPKKSSKRIKIIKSKLPVSERVLLTDIDNTLLGSKRSLKKLIKILKKNSDNLAFGVATGRSLESALNVLLQENVPIPDILITAVGSEIYYGPKLIKDKGWSRCISYRWKPHKISSIMKTISGAELQPDQNQGEFKLSYYYNPEDFCGPNQIRKIMRSNNIYTKVICSHGKYLDFLPIRASKGQAIHFICLKWGIDQNRVLVAGDSGNDRDMLSAMKFGVVVGNYSPELRSLRKISTIYFARSGYAGGIIEGMKYFDFLEDNDED